VAYATQEIGSEQNTGRAIFLGGSVSTMRLMASARPMNALDQVGGSGHAQAPTDGVLAVAVTTRGQRQPDEDGQSVSAVVCQLCAPRLLAPTSIATELKMPSASATQ